MAAYDKDTVTDEQLAAAKAAALKYIQDFTAAQVAAGVKSTDKSARLPGESASAANARITQAYKDQEQPALTKEGAAAGATINYVRTGSGGVGEYKEVFPIGAPIPEARTTQYGNTYDAQGNLISGTGLKPGVGTSTGSTVVTPVEKNPILAAGGSSAGADASGKEVFYKMENNGKVGFYYADGSKVPTDNLIGVKQAVDLANAGWAIQVFAKGQTPASVKCADIIRDAENRGPVRGSDAYAVGDVYVTRDGNGVSLYDSNGNLISGKGSQYQVGLGTTAGKQVNIAAVGAYGSPDYNPNAGYTGSSAKPAGIGNIGNVSSTGAPVNMSTSGMTNPYAPGTADYANFNDRSSAYNILYNEFSKYGLGSLVEGIKGLIQSNVSPSQFAIELQNTDAYKKRFAANQDRIAQGLRALTPAEYIGLEDQYQNIMRNYGLPSSYYTKDSMGTQAGFQKFIANDISASELEDRIATAQQRVINSNPEVLQALKQFYPDINNADILAYALDPSQALANIKRKVTAAEIGGAALAQGLQPQGGTAESLAGYGVTKAQAQQGYADVANILPRGSQLADIYGQSPYTQQTAEAEIFNTAGSADAAAKRKKLKELEQASFGGSSGVGSLSRDRAVSNYMLGQPGAGSY